MLSRRSKISRDGYTVGTMRSGLMFLVVTAGLLPACVAQSSQQSLPALIGNLKTAPSPVDPTFLLLIDRLTLPPSTVTATQAKLKQLASNPTVPVAIRKQAALILPCWVNDRHRPCPNNSYPSVGR
jgi:predicted Na+-dependent transporter